MTDIQIQTISLVDREIFVCLSSLVNEFIERDASGFLDSYPALASGYVDNEDGAEEYIEIYEYWAVSSWLADKLKANGERVDSDFYGLCIWGRTTTGQAISMDSVIEDIVKDIGF